MTQRTASHVPAAPASLPCPACAKAVPLDPAHAVEGASLRCPHCGLECDLTHEWLDGAETYEWMLVDPATEYPDEPA